PVLPPAEAGGEAARRTFHGRTPAEVSRLFRARAEKQSGRRPLPDREVTHLRRPLDVPGNLRAQLRVSPDDGPRDIPLPGARGPAPAGAGAPAPRRVSRVEAPHPVPRARDLSPLSRTRLRGVSHDS